MEKKQRVGEIEFWRAIFCLIVFVYHVGLDSKAEHVLFPSGQIGVEFFFLVSGLFLAKAAKEKQDTNCENLGKETAMYVVRKYLRLFPYHIIAFGSVLLAFIITRGYNLIECIEYVLLILPQAFLIHMTGIMDERVMSIEWYLSCMLIAMMVLYPLLRKWYQMYVYVIAPLVSLSVFGYLYIRFGHILNKYNWAGITTTGVWRAIALMNIGCIAYELAVWMSGKEWKMLQRWLWTLLALLGYGLTIAFANSQWNDMVRFTLVFLLLSAVAVSYSDVGVFHRFFQHPGICFLGKISLPFYLNTDCIRYFLRAVDINERSYPLFMGIAIGLNVIGSSLEVMIVEKLFRKRRKGV